MAAVRVCALVSPQEVRLCARSSDVRSETPKSKRLSTRVDVIVLVCSSCLPNFVQTFQLTHGFDLLPAVTVEVEQECRKYFLTTPL